MKTFLIIGMGSFGHHLCRALAEQKCEVMIVDQRSECLEDMLPQVASARVGDCTNPEVLRSFSIESFDACFVCLGEDVLGSLQVRLNSSCATERMRSSIRSWRWLPALRSARARTVFLTASA